MIHINVVLPNGHSELLTLEPSSTLQELKTEAAQAFGKKIPQTYHCSQS